MLNLAIPHHSYVLDLPLHSLLFSYNAPSQDQGKSYVELAPHMASRFADKAKGALGHVADAAAGVVGVAGRVGEVVGTVAKTARGDYDGSGVLQVRAGFRGRVLGELGF